MPIYPKELLLGSDKVLAHMEPNNNKFENLLVISEDEQQVYLAPSSKPTTETGSFVEKNKEVKAGYPTSARGGSITQTSQASFSSPTPQ